jgi:hypothetical protein
MKPKKKVAAKKTAKRAALPAKKSPKPVRPKRTSNGPTAARMREATRAIQPRKGAKMTDEDIYVQTPPAQPEKPEPMAKAAPPLSAAASARHEREQAQKEFYSQRDPTNGQMTNIVEDDLVIQPGKK